MANLHIESDGVLRGAPVPSNLNLSASVVRNKSQHLLQLLKAWCELRFHFADGRSMTRSSAPARSLYTVRDSLTPKTWQGTSRPAVLMPSGASLARNTVITMPSYHAGLSPGHRSKIQSSFMTGRLRVVVATIAFGMGLDKP